MRDIVAMPAEPRERAGKGSARAARRAGRVPAVIYGAKKDPTMITLENKHLTKLLHSAGFYATLFDIESGGNKDRVLARDVQFDPVTDVPVHVDFLRVSASTTVNVQVPVVFLNEETCEGLIKGGVLNVVRHEIELVSRADAIPQQIEIDLTGLDVGDGVHISMVKLPDGVAPTITDRDFTIATIAAPKLAVEEEETEDEEGLEGEAVEDAEATAEDAEESTEASEE